MLGPNGVASGYPTLGQAGAGTSAAAATERDDHNRLRMLVVLAAVVATPPLSRSETVDGARSWQCAIDHHR